jgi:hypothetical protein
MFNQTRVRSRTPLACAVFSCLRALTASILVYCGLALTPAGASAGRYHVYSCRTPNGQPAPTDGWTSTTTPASATVIATDTCASGGSLTAALGDGVEHSTSTSASWVFVTPASESIAQATLWRAGEADGGSVANAYYEFWLAGPENLHEPSYVFDECVASFSCPIGGIGDRQEVRSVKNIVTVPSENLARRLYLNASCGGQPGFRCPEGKKDTDGNAADVYLYAADSVIEQTTQPTITPGTVGGELATASKLSGTASATFEAGDAGAGIYEAIVEVDEKTVGSTTLDSNGGHCADVGQTADGLAAFLYLQPCAALVSADVPLDTTSLSNGVHHIVVSVADAAGNRTVVLDRKVEVANAVPVATPPAGALTQSAGGAAAPSGVSGLTALMSPNGSPSASEAVLSAHWGSSAKTAIVGRWGSAQTIAGRLTSATGVPISGATVEVAATPSAQGARASLVGAARTAADGRFSVRLSPHSSSESLAIAYHAHTGDPVPAATSTLVLRVPASLSLGVSPRTSHAGGRIVFKGVLRGGHIPASGKQIVLQARAPGAGWRTFQALSTDRRGRYRASYRFRLPGPVTYRFRALSRQEADFPFASGSSNTVTVFEH